MKNAQNCDGDLLLVHTTQADEAFVADGFGSNCADVMYNDFIIVGPSEDTAGIRRTDNVCYGADDDCASACQLCVAWR